MLNTSRPLGRKESFLREIKGSQVVIPDLYALFPGWIFNINSNYETVKKKSRPMAREVRFSPFTHSLHTESHRSCAFSWLESEALRHRMQIANFSRLAACLYPDALEEECLMMSYYHLWVLLSFCISYSLLLFRFGCFRYSSGTMVHKAPTVYRLSFLTFVFSMSRA